MPYRISGTRAAQQDSTQPTQMSGMMFGRTNSTLGPPPPALGGNPGGGEGFSTSYGLGGGNPNATQGYQSGSMNQAYTNPIRRPGQPMRRM